MRKQIKIFQVGDQIHVLIDTFDQDFNCISTHSYAGVTPASVSRIADHVACSNKYHTRPFLAAKSLGYVAQTWGE